MEIKQQEQLKKDYILLSEWYVSRKIEEGYSVIQSREHRNYNEFIYLQSVNSPYQQLFNPYDDWNQLMPMCRYIVSHGHALEGLKFVEKLRKALDQAHQDSIYYAVAEFVKWEMEFYAQMERRKNAKTFDELIMGLKVDEKLDLESYGQALQWVDFSAREYRKGEGLKYCWCAQYSYKNRGLVGYVHPLKSSNYVQTFKTLNGAKRNFIKRYKDIYTKVTCKLEKK
jgi:hypothetical protein